MQELLLLKVLKFFFENPYEEIYLRRLAKEVKISPFAAKKYADMLLKEGMIKEERKGNLRYFRANVNNLFFRYLKTAFSINSILKSGLVGFLTENLANVSSMVLFGSVAKGTDDKKSDIDILLIGKEKHLNLGKFEEKMGMEIIVHIFSWSEWNKKAKEDKPFYFEVISGAIPLYGEIPFVWK